MKEIFAASKSNPGKNPPLVTAFYYKDNKINRIDCHHHNGVMSRHIGNTNVFYHIWYVCEILGRGQQ